MEQPSSVFLVRAQSDGSEPEKKSRVDASIEASVDFVTGFPDCTPPKLGAPVRTQKSIALEFDIGRRLSRGL